MTNEQVTQEISIIKTMIEKARRETAESGHFFIWMGIVSIIAVFVINRLETYALDHLVLPILFILMAICGIIGYFTVNRKIKQERVQSYPKTLCYSVWFACSIPLVIVTFVFPILKVYQWNLIPVFSSLMIGIAVFSSGVIFESRPIIWCSIAWWIGAFAMAFITDTRRMFIMMGIILIGWILPGLILNRQYKNRSLENES